MPINGSKFFVFSSFVHIVGADTRVLKLFLISHNSLRLGYALTFYNNGIHVFLHDVKYFVGFVFTFALEVRAGRGLEP